jgi:hypothetical protein
MLTALWQIYTPPALRSLLYLRVSQDYKNKVRLFFLNDVHKLIFKMETSCVSFKIKTEFLNTFPMEVVLQV